MQSNGPGGVGVLLVMTIALAGLSARQGLGCMMMRMHPAAEGLMLSKPFSYKSYNFECATEMP